MSNDFRITHTGLFCGFIPVYLDMRDEDEPGIMARLLLWTDPKPLPALNRPDDAFDYYLRNWRPGAYTRGTPAQRAEIRSRWGRAYAKAMVEVGV